MGLIIKKTKWYFLNSRFNFLASFLDEYVYHRNRTLVQEAFPSCTIVWQDRNNKMIVSTLVSKAVQGFVSAAYSRLDELGSPFVHQNEYYIYDPFKDKNVEREEAYVQTLIVDSKNPRVLRVVREEILKGMLERSSAIEWGLAYGLDKELIETVLMDG